MLLSADAKLDRSSRGVEGIDLIDYRLREQQTMTQRSTDFRRCTNRRNYPPGEVYRDLNPLLHATGWRAVRI